MLLPMCMGGGLGLITGDGKKRTFLVILSSADGSKPSYLSASRQMPKVKNNILLMNSGFKYTMNKGMNFCLTAFQMITANGFGNICYTRKLKSKLGKT